MTSLGIEDSRKIAGVLSNDCRGIAKGLLRKLAIDCYDRTSIPAISERKSFKRGNQGRIAACGRGHRFYFFGARSLRR